MQTVAYTYRENVLTSQKSEKNARRGYHFGFNGHEKDNEVYGDNNSYTAEYWQYDPRLGRWMAVDPLANKFSYISPYNFAENNPILFIDYDGREIIIGTKNVADPEATKQQFKSQLSLYFDNKVKVDIDRYGVLTIQGSPKNLTSEQQANFDRLKDMVNDQKNKIQTYLIDHTNQQSHLIDDDSYSAMALDIGDVSTLSHKQGSYNTGIAIMHFFDEQWHGQTQRTKYNPAHNGALNAQLKSSGLIFVNGTQVDKTDAYNYSVSYDIIDANQNYVETLVRKVVDGNYISSNYSKEPAKVGTKIEINSALSGQVESSAHLESVKPK